MHIRPRLTTFVSLSDRSSSSSIDVSGDGVIHRLVWKKIILDIKIKDGKLHIFSFTALRRKIRESSKSSFFEGKSLGDFIILKEKTIPV